MRVVVASMLLGAATTAFAGDAPPRVSPAPPPLGEEPSEEPLAIPAEGQPDAPPGEEDLGEISAEALKAMREYRLRHLQLRDEYTYTGGGTQVVQNPYSWGGPAIITREPITTTYSWAVYQGPMRLDVPAYLEVAGQDELRRDLIGRIERKKWLSRFYYGVAAGGVAAIVAGGVGRANAEDSETAFKWTYVGTVGLGGTVIGLIGGSLPAASAQRLRTDFGRTVDMVEAQRVVDEQNEALRVELGLTPDQALQVEAEDERATERFMIR